MRRASPGRCPRGAGLFAAGLGLASSNTLPAKLTARLTAGAERPTPRAAAPRRAGSRRRWRGPSLAWRLTFSGLSGKAVAAHVHLGRVGVAGPVAVPLCGPCASGAHGALKVGREGTPRPDQPGRLRERAHAEEPGRRDPRPDPERQGDPDRHHPGPARQHDHHRRRWRRLRRLLAPAHAQNE